MKVSSLLPFIRTMSERIEYRDSPIAGRGVFALTQFNACAHIVPFAPRVTSHPYPGCERYFFRRKDGSKVIPDRSVPGGWLCNQSCRPNARLHPDVQCVCRIQPGEEVTVFYNWLLIGGEPLAMPCHCGYPECRGTVETIFTDADLEGGYLREDSWLYITEGSPLDRRMAEVRDFYQRLHIDGMSYVADALRRHLAASVCRVPPRLAVFLLA
jgi:hypothetical protein